MAEFFIMTIHLGWSSTAWLMASLSYTATSLWQGCDPWNIFFRFTGYAKPFNCVDYSKLWKILKRMGVPNHLTYLLRNLYVDQDTTVRIRHGTTDWFKIGKGILQNWLLSSCLICMQSIACKILGWMNHKLESRLPGKISTTSDMQKIPL